MQTISLIIYRVFLGSDEADSEIESSSLTISRGSSAGHRVVLNNSLVSFYTSTRYRFTRLVSLSLAYSTPVVSLLVLFFVPRRDFRISILLTFRISQPSPLPSAQTFHKPILLLYSYIKHRRQVIHPCLRVSAAI